MATLADANSSFTGSTGPQLYASPTATPAVQAVISEAHLDNTATPGPPQRIIPVDWRGGARG